VLKTPLPAALAAAVVASSPALAQEKLPDVRVCYGDLDLADPEAIRTVERRLNNAVKAVCPSDKGLREITQLRMIGSCLAAKCAEIAPLRATPLAAAANARNAAILTRRSRALRSPSARFLGQKTTSPADDDRS
jgi:UrcA family protein